MILHVVEYKKNKEIIFSFWWSYTRYWPFVMGITDEQ